MHKSPWQNRLLLVSSGTEMKRLVLPLLVFLLVMTGFITRAQQDHLWQNQLWQIQASPQSEVSYTPNGEVVWNHGIIISNRDTTLTSERGIANPATGDVHAEGGVTILAKNHIWEGTNVSYNFITRKMDTGEFKTTAAPFFVEGTGLGSMKSNTVYAARNGVVTTDDYSEPLYEIRAQLLIICPNQYIEAYNATLWLRSVPVMYVPHYKRAIGRHPHNFVFIPGYQSTYGAYLLTTYNWYINTNLDGGVHADYRSRRGPAGGPDINYHLGNWGDGSFQYYYTRDQDPNADAIAGPLPEERKRINFYHMAEPMTNLTAKVVARYESDPQVRRDFFENEYKTNVQPSSYTEVTHLWPNFTFDAMAQPRLVDFYETVERLPDLKLSGARQQVGATPVYYESESSFGYYRRRFSDTNELGYSDYSAARGDSYHQFTLPQTYFGCMNFVPRVGGRGTYYSDVQDTQVSTNEQVRGVFNTGAEVSTKASQLWRNPENDFFEVDGLRHIIEPSVNYVYVPKPTRTPNQLPQFDYESPSLRLLPIDYPDYNSIDSVDSQNVLRLGLRNKLQTKRENGVDNLVNWALVTDWRLDPRDDQATFSDVYSDVDFKPRSWLLLNSQLRWDTENERWRDTYHAISIRPNSTWSWTLSHHYHISDDPSLMTTAGESIPGYNTYGSTFYFRFNENWGARIAHRFEARDGKMEEQYYTLYRDLRSWTSALTLRWRENNAGERDDFTVAVTFSLKAFPRFSQGEDTIHPSSLLGY